MRGILLTPIVMMIFVILLACGSAQGLQNPDTVKLIKKHALNPDGSPMFPEWYKVAGSTGNNKQLIFIDQAEESERVMPTSKKEMEKYVGR